MAGTTTTIETNLTSMIKSPLTYCLNLIYYDLTLCIAVLDKQVQNA